MMRPWLIVVDASSARFLQQNKDGSIVEVLPKLLAANIAAIRERDKGTHKPGKAINSGTGIGAHHRFEPHTSWHDINRDIFCAEIIKILHQHQQRFDLLTLIAPPKILGVLRVRFDKSLSKKIGQEIAKDLTKLTLTDLKEYINPPYFLKK